jgi:hypothetical protein
MVQYKERGNCMVLKCSGCQQWLDESEFAKHSGKKHRNYKQAECKKCASARLKKHFQQNKDKIKNRNKENYHKNKEYQKKYRQTHIAKERKKKYMEKYKQTTKYFVNQLLKNFRKKGLAVERSDITDEIINVQRQGVLAFRLKNQIKKEIEKHEGR